MELLLHQWEDWPELYRNTDKTEATEIVIIDSQMNYRGKLDTYVDLLLFSFLFIIHGQMTGIYKAGYFAFRFLLNLFGAFSAFPYWFNGPAGINGDRCRFSNICLTEL